MSKAGPLIPDAVHAVEDVGLAGRSARRTPAMEAPERTVGSVVIPAHNEAKVIGRGLDRLFDSLGAGIEVIVICNGCTDDTADLVRRRGHHVTVIELAAASKERALRAADRIATAFPRVYLDADVLVSGTAIHAVLEHLSRPGALAARPPLTYDTSSSTWIVRRFYRARAEIPAVMGSLWGAGVFALSADGRGRFDEFPLQLADDRLFRADEIELVDTAPWWWRLRTRAGCWRRFGGPFAATAP
jgi:glycosyltransferase involved in cell wall biosynthesis